jgi:hypothetical protein
LKQARDAQDISMYEPGLERHDWESEFAAIEEDLHTDPAESLAELDDLVHRMLLESGYDVDDPVVRTGDEREVVAEYLAAHEIHTALERDAPNVSPGDVAAAINGYRSVYEFLIANRGVTDADFAARELEHPEET